jgi:hypothetical protein
MLSVSQALRKTVRFVAEAERFYRILMKADPTNASAARVRGPYLPD